MKTIPRLWIVGFLVLLLQGPAVLAQSSATTATVLLTIKGKDGELLGEVTQKGREGQHRVLAFNHEIASQRDLSSGLPTGKRQHQPLRVVKYINRSSPLLLNAMAKSDVFPEVTLTVWATAATGLENVLVTYTLSDARIVDLRVWMPNKLDAAAQSYVPSEEVAFSYSTITVTYAQGGIVGSDGP